MQNKTIIITGATSGIGRDAALACACNGANVVAAGRRVERGEQLVDEITDAGGSAIFVPTDVSEAAAVEQLVEAALSRYSRLDFAFNNAGLFTAENKFAEHDEQVWQQQIATALTGTYNCMKYQLRAMLANQNESSSSAHQAIINNASSVAFTGSTAAGAAYTACKHGILGLTRQAAVEYAHTSIRVNAVCPGPTLTESTAAALNLPDEQRQVLLQALNPTAQLVSTSDIASAVIYLCSDAAHMINGHGLPLDGGQLAQL